MGEPWQQALEEVRQRAGGPGSTVWLATVGTWMADAGCPPAQLPTKLSRFLAGLTGFCRLEGGGRVLFLDGAPEGPSLQLAEQPSEPPDFRLADAYHKALVDSDEGVAWYLDLATDELVRLTTSDAPPEEPERLLRLPVLGAEEERRLAASLLGPNLEIPEGSDGLDVLRSQLDGATRARLDRERQACLLRRTREWVERHGLREDRFISPRPRRRTPPAEAAEPEDLRLLLRRALDISTGEELRAWTVPASVLHRLVEDRQRTRRTRKKERGN